MKQLPFERPTEHYDERLISIDEQICSLIKQRKDISNNNPGFPSLEDISKWAEKYGLYEELLYSVFGVLVNDEFHRPQVEPIDFQKYIPVLKSVELEQTVYTIPLIRQYANASVINLTIDYEPDTRSITDRMEHHGFLELSLGEEYDCRVVDGGGTEGHMAYNYIVSPPLPDDLSKVEFHLIEYQTPYKRKPTGLEFSIK